ncbi:hypothetical protein LCGC14_1727700, partial [marine sediment metagenome]
MNNSEQKGKEKKMCSCGFPQSSPVPHKHDWSEREKAIFEYGKKQRLEDLVHTAKVFQQNETKKDAQRIIKHVQMEAKKMPKGFSGC